MAQVVYILASVIKVLLEFVIDLLSIAVVTALVLDPIASTTIHKHVYYHPCLGPYEAVNVPRLGSEQRGQ